MRTRGLFLSTLVLLTGCGGGSSMNSSSEISGAYEFVVSSNITGSTTLVEANMAANGSESAATGPNQVQIITLENKIWYVNGVCPGNTPGQNAVTTTNNDGQVAVTFNEGGNKISGQAVLTGTTISGNFSVNDSNCPDLNGLIGVPPHTDSGGFTGNPVPKLAGTYSGVLSLPDGQYNAAFTLTEANNNALTVNAALKGPTNNGNVIFTGTAVGNVIFVSGSLQGGALSLFGLLDVTGRLTGAANSLLIFNYATLASCGLLIGS
jgi:hypothetical protein